MWLPWVKLFLVLGVWLIVLRYNSKVIGIVWECCIISHNDNCIVAFGQNRSRRLLIFRGGGERGSGCSGSFLGPAIHRER